MSDATPLTCERFARGEGIVVLALSGELVVTNRDSLERRAGEEMSNGARAVVLDLGGLRHVDTAGLALLVQLSHRAAQHGSRLAVARLGSFAEEMRRSLFLEEAILFAESVEDAVAAVSG